MWDAPAECPSVSSIESRVEQRLGRALDPALEIHIAVTQRDGHFVAKLWLGATERSLTSDRCDALADAIAIIVSRVAEEHNAVPRVATAEVAAEAAAAIVPRVETVQVHRDLAEPAITHPWSLGVRLSGVSGIGIVPEVGLGAEVAISARHNSMLAELAATKWLASGADRSTSHVDVGLGVTAARVGWRPEVLPLRAWVEAEVGSMDGTGTNLSTSQPNSGRWFAAGAGFGVGWPMTPWLRLVGSTEALIAIERVQFIEGSGEVVYAPSPVSARATVGIEVGWE
ncbi:MAG: hypothetical protein ABJE66_30030 [Deltaproteobacteria bacterium]